MFDFGCAAVGASNCPYPHTPPEKKIISLLENVEVVSLFIIYTILLSLQCFRLRISIRLCLQYLSLHSLGTETTNIGNKIWLMFQFLNRSLLTRVMLSIRVTPERGHLILIPLPVPPTSLAASWNLKLCSNIPFTSRCYLLWMRSIILKKRLTVCPGVCQNKKIPRGGGGGIVGT